MVDVIVGLQWGDEGKGRIVDWYARDYDIVARFGGGDNAGHTIAVGGRKLALRIVPSAVLQERCELFVGGGTVVSVTGLLAELDSLKAIGVEIGRVKISDRAHVVFAYHADDDRAAEAARGSGAIGTTGRGIGPAYVDKVARRGVAFGDLMRGATPAGTLRDSVAFKEACAAAQRLRAHVVDGAEYMHRALADGRRVLAEGAQGTLLDVGYGTYPFVTSSSTIAGAACTGLGIGPRAIGSVTGVVKAYATRVGGGPFPSELKDEIGDRLRAAGAEFGTVTGRPRRCGWFDAVAARYAAQLNGLTGACVTKLDVLSGFERLGIVTQYRSGGQPLVFGEIVNANAECQIDYMPGWSEDISGVRRMDELPANAAAYVRRIAEALDAPVTCVSVGPERSQLAV